MAIFSPDTSPQIEQMQIEYLRQMPVWRKMALLAEMNQTVRELTLVGLRQRHPDDSPAKQRRRLANLLLGPELATRAYGAMPEDA
jgi:hypothetical protein